MQDAWPSVAPRSLDMFVFVCALQAAGRQGFSGASGGAQSVQYALFNQLGEPGGLLTQVQGQALHRQLLQAYQ